MNELELKEELEQHRNRHAAVLTALKELKENPTDLGALMFIAEIRAHFDPDSPFKPRKN